MNNKELNILISNFRTQSSESECIEFKEAKTDFDFRKLGKYFSALANEANLKNVASAWLVFGIKDRPIPRKIVGTNYRNNKAKLNNLKLEIADKTTNRITFTEIYELNHIDGRILIFQIPPSPKGLPIAFDGHYYGRDNESLGALNMVEIESIRAQVINEDWSAKIIPDATINDLDKEAIQKAIFEYKNKFPNLSYDVDKWDTLTFLNKARITIKGKITNTAIILLGKSESEVLLSPSQAKITWILKNENNTELDWSHFSPPLLSNVKQVLNKIRNLKYRFIVGDTLFPKEINMYDTFVIREALHNCIAHQDYSKTGKIILVEFPNRLVFKNEGLFIPKDINTVIYNDAPDTKNRNQFLLNAMFNLNMIDTIGSGIKRMFTIQKERLFPLPEYTINDTAVSVNIYGEVLSNNFAEYLSKHKNITLEQTIILDKVQKANKLNNKELDYLKSINYSTKIDKVKLESDQVSDQGNNFIINTLEDINIFINKLSHTNSDQVSDQVSNQVTQILNKVFKNKILNILTNIKSNEKSKGEILAHIRLSNHTTNKRRYIDPLLEYNWITYTIPDNTKDRNQKYKLTKKGLILLNLMNHHL